MRDVIKEVQGVINEHIARYRTDPDKAHIYETDMGLGIPPGTVKALLLTTKGRKTGKPNISPLFYMKDGDGYVVIASRGGAQIHAQWYLNLMTDPLCDIQVGREIFRGRAREVTGAERTRLFDAMAKLYPVYPEYKKTAAPREIPVLVIEPLK